MRFIKNFEKFMESSTEPMVKPGRPDVKPDVKPGKPIQKPERPSPIRRDRPSVEPDPKAKVKKKSASAEEVAERFIDLMVKGNEDVKKYTKTI